MLKCSQPVLPGVCLKFSSGLFDSEIAHHFLPVGCVDVACCGDGSSRSSEAQSFTLNKAAVIRLLDFLLIE